MVDGVSRGLSGTLDEPFSITLDGTRAESNVLAMQTRSLLGVLNALAQPIGAPAEHERAGRVQSLETEEVSGVPGRWLEVEHGLTPATDAFVQVFYANLPVVTVPTGN